LAAQPPATTRRTITLVRERPGQGWACAIAILALAGVLFCLLLLMQSGYSKSFALPMLCGQVSGCELVQQSRWGRIGPIPAATIGLAYFAAVACWFFTVGRPNSAGRGWHWFPAILVGLGCAGSVYYLYVMFVVLRAFCPLCTAVHVVNVLVLLGVLRLWPRRRSDLPAGHAVMPAPTVRLGVTALALAATWSVTMIIGSGAFLAMLRSTYASDLQQLAQDVDFARFLYQREVHHDVPVSPQDVVRGPPDAVHTVVAFTDYQCPACARFDKAWREIPDSLRQRARLVLKHYPLHSRCNAHTKSNMHFFSCDAARAAEAVRLLSGNSTFWKAHDWLFENQRRLDVRPYRELAEAVGLDPDRLLAEMNSPEVAARIKADTDAGGELNFQGTPAVFLDGRKVQLWNVPAFWQEALASPPLPASSPATEPSTRPATNPAPE
jgi:protein-disulfide isomerase/uncharacterized membrane protein